MIYYLQKETLYENDTRALYTLFCDRFAGSW